MVLPVVNLPTEELKEFSIAFFRGETKKAISIIQNKTIPVNSVLDEKT